VFWDSNEEKSRARSLSDMLQNVIGKEFNIAEGTMEKFPKNKLRFFEIFRILKRV
jgi:hypothetical protein